MLRGKKRCELTTETANQQQKQCIGYQQKGAESSSYVHLCENKKGYPPPLLFNDISWSPMYI